MRLLPRSNEARIVLGVGAVLAGLNVVAVVVDAVAPSPEGPRSSSFATSREGLAAWAELAHRSGREVRALRERPSDESLPGSGTVVMLDPQEFTVGQARALRGFAERGGRVVVGGLRPGRWMGGLGPVPAWRAGGSEDARVLVPGPDTGGAARLLTAGEGRWLTAREALPIVGGRDGGIVLVRRAGQGRIVFVADASPLQNRLLGEADNAAFALALAGDGPLVFVESVHGYTTATGLAALPARFRWALVLLALSGLLLIAARWPRMGPPEPPEEPRFPPRRAYVDALAATLAKSRDRSAAVESVRSAARERLARRAALARDADDEAWFEAARAVGLGHEEARALVEGDDDGIAAGRALAQLSGGEERSRA